MSSSDVESGGCRGDRAGAPGGERPRVSIITVALNSSRTLETCLESVASQTLPGVEHLVVDGGSTAGPLAVLRRWNRRIAWWVSAPDRGIYDAMNKAIAQARGEWLMFLGADDALAASDVLDRCARFFDPGAAVVYGDVRFTSGERFASRADAGLLVSNRIHHQGAFYAARVFDGWRYDTSLRVVADYELNLRLYRAGERFVRADVIVAVCGDAGVSNARPWRSFREMNRVRRRYVDAGASARLTLQHAVEFVRFVIQRAWRRRALPARAEPPAPIAADPPPRRDACCAVVVTYHPDEGFPDRVVRISAQVARVYVVDNGSNERARQMLAAIATRDPAVVLLLVDTNEGIAAALNRGCDRALADGFAWAVTCDQDSVVDANLVPELASIWAEHPARERVKIVAPNYVMGTGDEGILFPPGTGRWHEMSTAITSGALTSLDGYLKAGPFRTDYFIDSVDEEFCLRLRRRGMVVVCARRALMRHALGNARKHRILGRDFPQSHHATFRRYYIARNRILTLRAFWLREPRWAISRAKAMLIEFFTVPLLESDAWAKLSAMIVGTWHGIIGRTGKADRAF